MLLDVNPLFFALRLPVCDLFHVAVSFSLLCEGWMKGKISLFSCKGFFLMFYVVIYVNTSIVCS